MTEDLRPMNPGAILDRGVQIFRTRPLVFLGLAAIPSLVQLGSALASVHPKSPFLTHDPGGYGLFGASYLASFLLWVAEVLINPVATAAICLAACRTMFGETITVGAAFGVFRSRALALFGLAFLQGLYCCWPFIVVVFIAVTIALGTGMSPASMSLLIPLYLVGIIPCVALYSRYALAFPVTVVEGLPTAAAIDRSISLSEGGRWRISVGFVIPHVPSVMLGLSSLVLVAHFKTHSPLLAGSPLAVAAIRGTVSLIVQLIFNPYGSIVMTLLYYDQRIRREGYDVERLMETSGLEAAPAPAAISEPLLPAAAEENRA